MTAISTSLEISPQPDEKLANGSRRLARLLHLDIVACSRNDADAGAGDALTEEARVLRGRELILLATDHERGRLHGRDPAHDVEGVTRLEIPEHHSGRILGRCPMQRRPQLGWRPGADRSEEHTSELQSPCNLVCRLLLEKKKRQHYLRPPARLHQTRLRSCANPGYECHQHAPH